MPSLIFGQSTRSELADRINAFEGLSIDKFGHLEVDMGSANAGRFGLNLNAIQSITLEFRGEEPGCADVCPQRAIIKFICKGGAPCTWDQAMSNEIRYESASVAVGLKEGLDIYLLLLKFKYLEFIDLSAFEYPR